MGIGLRKLNAVIGIAALLLTAAATMTTAATPVRDPAGRRVTAEADTFPVNVTGQPVAASLAAPAPTTSAASPC